MTLDINAKTDEARNYLSEQIKHNDFLTKKNEKACSALNYFEHFPVFISFASGCVSITLFPSIVSVPIGIASSAVQSKICALTAAIKKY